MKNPLLIVGLISVLLAACGKQDEQQAQTLPSPAPATSPAPPPGQTPSPPPSEAVPETTNDVDATAPEVISPSENTAAENAAPSAPPVTEDVSAPAPVPRVMSQDDALVLANRSGCLACHAVYKKVVGPAWQDVAARYRGKDVRAQLVEKISKGGKGNWTDVTGGIPMPPYSPRVANGDIEKLVDFILSLN